MKVFLPDQELSIGDIRSQQDQLPFTMFRQSNFGFQENSVWLYKRLHNASIKENWVVSINYTQLSRADLYLFENNKLVYSKKAGTKDNSEFYRVPTFVLRLNNGSHYELYFRLKAERQAIIAPIVISDAGTHSASITVDAMIWGAFYGGFVILSLYALSVLIGKKEKLAIFLLIQLASLILWQFVWTGHSQHLPVAFKSTQLFSNLDFLLPLISSLSFLFIYVFVKHKLSNRYYHYIARVVLGAHAVIMVLIAADYPAELTQALMSRVAAFVTLIYGLLISGKALLSDYQPAFPLVIGSAIMIIGAIISTLYVIDKLPVSTLNTYIFQLSFISMTCAFALSLNHKLRYGLEIEIAGATKDVENHFLLIEEQNVRLNIARNEALKASEVKSQFLANMSHEIRTPLNAILGFSNELMANPNPSEKEDYIGIINTSASDLLTIINDILDLSKIEAGKLSLNNKPFSPFHVFEEMATLVAKNAHLKNLQFVFDVAAMPSTLIGDKFKIKQLMNNLLSNALKFTNHGCITMRGKCNAKSATQIELLIEIEDTGIGISKDDQDKLFKPFNQLDNETNRTFQGTGLGLAICQELSFLMGGDLEVESRETLGTKFTLKLPFEVLKAEVFPREQAFWQQKTACLCDPDPNTRRATSQLLKLLGLKTSTFESLDCLLAQQQRYDIGFVTLQKHTNEQHNTLVADSKNLAADTLVFLYTDTAPKTAQIEHANAYPVAIRLPLTTKKLEHIYKTPNKASSNKDKASCKLPEIKLLAVDDNAINLRLLKAWLKDSPINLRVAESGKEAVERCTNSAFDIILMDIQMPNMDGMQASKLIRKTKLNQGTPIIAITAHAFDEEKQQFLSSGMDDYLPKPIDFDKLIELINQWCKYDDIDGEKSNKEPINWELAKQRSNSDAIAAYDFLEAFSTQQSKTSKQIEHFWQQQAYDELLVHIHKLHGACCYTGVATLQSLCNEIESGLKSNALEDLPKLIPALLLELESVSQQWVEMRNSV